MELIALKSLLVLLMTPTAEKPSVYSDFRNNVFLLAVTSKHLSQQNNTKQFNRQTASVRDNFLP